jgi:hypothetical protein
MYSLYCVLIDASRQVGCDTDGAGLPRLNANGGSITKRSLEFVW